MENILSYQDFLQQAYIECKNADWFPDVLEACHSIDTDDLVVSALIGEIHEGLRINFDEAIKYFWTVFLVNPLIAIKAYQETDLLLGKVDVYTPFADIYSLNHVEDQPGSEWKGIYNSSVEYFLIYAIEAMLQKDMIPEELHSVYSAYLRVLYNHDKEIMGDKSQHDKEGENSPAKWLNQRNLQHILNATDPHHLIILLDFFAYRYGARLRQGNVGNHCYSGDKYDDIIDFIKYKYGSLSEYIEWEIPSYAFHYVRYYKRSLYHKEMFDNMDVVFPTKEDKKRIRYMVGIRTSGTKHYAFWRTVNKLKNPHHKTGSVSENRFR